jgi:hypothetical protein
MCNNKTLSTSWIPFIFCSWVHRQRTSLPRYGVLIRLHHVQCLNTCIRRTKSDALPQAAATIWAELHYVSPCLFILAFWTSAWSMRQINLPTIKLQ